jgi:ABC-type multidrug transport system fused ATPase/permease subunit
MFFVGLLSWWYGEGWRSRLRIMSNRLAATTDYFSISLLLSTLFAPFRQISAGSVGGSISNQARALVDKTISRLIGAIVRISMVIIGLLVIMFQIIINVFLLVLWPLIPALPVIGLIITIIGWVPLWQ